MDVEFGRQLQVVSVVYYVNEFLETTIKNAFFATLVCFKCLPVEIVFHVPVVVPP